MQKCKRQSKYNMKYQPNGIVLYTYYTNLFWRNQINFGRNLSEKFTISHYMSFRTISIKIHISYCQEQPPSQVVTSRQTINLMMFIRHPQILTKKIIKHLPFLVFPWRQEFNKNWFSFYWILSKSSMIHNFETILSALYERK